MITDRVIVTPEWLARIHVFLIFVGAVSSSGVIYLVIDTIKKRYQHDLMWEWYKKQHKIEAKNGSHD